MIEFLTVVRMKQVMSFTFLRHTLTLITSCFLLVACLDEQSGENTEKLGEPRPIITSRNAADKPFKASSESCGANQIEATISDLYYPGPKCEHIARNLDSERSMQKHILLCQEKTQASSPPSSAARVQISACGPAQSKAGIIYSKQICCDVPKPEPKKKPAEPRFKLHTYEAKLNCPKINRQALSTGLHFPDKPCSETVAAFKGGPSGNAHYQKACQRGLNNNTRQQILDAAVFTCNEDNSGAYLDVAICCSATLPKDKTMHPLTVPDDIWEIMRTGDLFALQLLLSREPEQANDKGRSGMSPLHLAGKVSFVNILLAKQADIEATDENGSTPLHYAAGKRQLDVVALLLKRGAKVNSTNIHGEIPLGFAKTPEIVNLLLSRGAKVNGASLLTSPLHNAAFYGQVEVAKQLIERGADVNRINHNGETPLHLAATGYSRTSIDVVRLLVKKGSNINALTTISMPRTPLDMAKKENIREFIQAQGGKEAGK